MKVKVTLKSGKVIEVMRKEVDGLHKAGKIKESKVDNMTKEEKNTGGTKEAKERMYPSKKRPVSISSKNFKGLKK